METMSLLHVGLLPITTIEAIVRGSKSNFPFHLFFLPAWKEGTRGQQGHFKAPAVLLIHYCL